MKKVIKILSYTLTLLFIGLIGLLAFLLNTTPGLYTSIKLTKLYLPGSLSVSHLKGRLRDEFSIGELIYQRDTVTFKINNLHMSWTIKSLLHGQLIVNHMEAEKLTINESAASHQLNNIALTGQMKQAQIYIDSLKFQYLNQQIYSQLQMGTQKPHELSGTIKLNPGSTEKALLKGNLSIAGNIDQLQWTGDFQGLATISLQGSLKQRTDLDQIIKWTNFNWQTPANNKISSPEGRIQVTGTLPNLNIKLSTKINHSDQEHWQINTSIQGTLPWQWNVNLHLLQGNDTHSKQPGLYSTISIQGIINDKNKAMFNLSISPGHYQLPEGHKLTSLNFEGGSLKAILTPLKLSGKGSFGIDANKKVILAFSMPGFALNTGISSKQPVSGELTLLVNSLDFLKGFNAKISDLKGQLTASLKTRGTLDNMPIESKITLSKGNVTIPELELNLNPVELTIIGKKQFWEANGSIGSANTSLILKGQGAFIPDFKGELSLKGTNFSIANSKEYQIRISPQLKLLFSPEGLNITGAILVPYAKIKPHTFSSSLAVSEDVIFVTQQKEPPRSTFNSSMDINVTMGDEVELTFKGLHATLAGTVNLKQQPQGPINANGELTVKQGEYKAYGQDLAIEQGELVFTGGRLDNPGINLRAQKKIETSAADITSSNQLFDFNNNNLQNANLQGAITVGVEVTGRLTAPKILLFSNPPILSQADILSMLVLGRPASQANKAGAQLLLAAISSMNLGNGTNGTQLLEQLKQKLGFDFNVQTSSNYNLVTNKVSDNTAVVVGKSLSKRIYLSYNVGLSQSDPNVLTLKYLLNKFLSIQISSSTTGNGIDILYTSSKNKDKS